MSTEADKFFFHQKPAPYLTDQTRADRAREIRLEVASARMQGLEPIPEFFAIAQRYVAGEFNLDEFSAAIRRLCPPV
jgi:antitoxin VbhA-like protein